METNTSAAEQQLALLKRIHRMSVIRTVACFLIMAFLLVSVFAVLPRLSSLLGELNSITSELAEIDFIAMTDSVNELTSVGASSISKASDELSSAMEGLKEIDFAALGESIDNLNAVSGSIAKVFGKK